MILADVLALASRKVSKPTVNGMNSLSPRLLVDFATLTGTTHNNINVNASCCYFDISITCLHKNVIG